MYKYHQVMHKHHQVPKRSVREHETILYNAKNYVMYRMIAFGRQNKVMQCTLKKLKTASS